MQQPDIIETIRRRKSVRTYDGRPLSAEDRAYVQALMATVDNPFGVKVRLHLAETGTTKEKLGTFGVIRDAQSFIGAETAWSPLAPLALGYQLESFVLGATAQGFASVWLGGTFKRAAFAKAMQIPTKAWFPVVLALGHAAARPSTAERALRRMTKADERELWRDLFTEDSFQVQLSEEAAGAYALPLEMLRLAPSAGNGQPWRVVKRGNVFYFYETHKASLGQEQVRLRQIDLGIAICHFHLTARALGLHGHFAELPLTDVRIPEDTFYHLSWVADEREVKHDEY